MLKRFSIHLLLIVLFAFTQVGLVTHEISHLADYSKHSQQDKNKAAEHCAQCVTYAEVASGLLTQAYIFSSFDAHSDIASPDYFNTLSLHYAAYAARAPPQFLNT